MHDRKYSGYMKIVRGGGWANLSPTAVQRSLKMSGYASDRDLGFRLVRRLSLTEQLAEVAHGGN